MTERIYKDMKGSDRSVFGAVKALVWREIFPENLPFKAQW
jgi:hypothetical protein